MTTTIQKWGNSLAVRLPKAIIQHLALKQGSGVIMRHDKDAIIIQIQEQRDSQIGKNDWKQYLIPLKHRKENISKNIDTILYGASH